MSISSIEELTNRQMVESSLSEIGERIRTTRKNRGLTQHELSQVAGVTQQCISSAECGRREPMSINLMKIARGLGCSTDYLLFGEFAENDAFLLLTEILKFSPDRMKLLMQLVQERTADDPNAEDPG